MLREEAGEKGTHTCTYLMSMGEWHASIRMNAAEKRRLIASFNPCGSVSLEQSVAASPPHASPTTSPPTSTGLVPSVETPTEQTTRRLMPASPCIDTGSAQRRWGCVSSSPRQKFSSFNIQPIWPKITGNSQNSSWSTAQFS